MQREIASVMAACGLRNIRYVTFPPVVFATPAPAAAPEPLPAPEAEAAPVMLEAVPNVVELVSAPAPMAAEAPVPPPLPAAEPAVVAAPAMAPPVPEIPVTPPVVIEPPAAPIPRVQPVVAEAPAPALASPAPHHAPRPGMRRLAELAAELAEARRPSQVAAHPPPVLPVETPPGVVPLRRYALLQDIAGELRPRRVRARSGKRA